MTETESSIQLLSMGLLTLLTASEPSLHRKALVARMGVHFLAAVIFSREGPKMRSGAALDLGFAVMNAIVLVATRD